MVWVLKLHSFTVDLNTIENNLNPESSQTTGSLSGLFSYCDKYAKIRASVTEKIYSRYSLYSSGYRHT